MMMMVRIVIVWQVPRAGNMNQIARCDWLPERARWSPLGTTRFIPQEKFQRKPYNISFIDKFAVRQEPITRSLQLP